MKNLNTNESTSFESSLGSPSKPLQSYDIQKAKQIFLVNSIEEPKISITNTIINLAPVPKPKPQEKKIPKKKIKLNSGLKPPKIKINNNKRHILDFDSIIKNLIFQGNKTANSGNKKIKNRSSKPKYKFVGGKRIRNFSNKDTKNKSK